MTLVVLEVSLGTDTRGRGLIGGGCKRLGKRGRIWCCRSEILGGAGRRGFCGGPAVWKSVHILVKMIEEDKIGWMGLP